MLYLSRLLFILIGSRLSKRRPGTGRGGSEGGDHRRGEFDHRSRIPGGATSELSAGTGV